MSVPPLIRVTTVILNVIRDVRANVVKTRASNPLSVCLNRLFYWPRKLNHFLKSNFFGLIVLVSQDY